MAGPAAAGDGTGVALAEPPKAAAAGSAAAVSAAAASEAIRRGSRRSSTDRDGSAGTSPRNESGSASIASGETAASHAASHARGGGLTRLRSSRTRGQSAPSDAGQSAIATGSLVVVEMQREKVPVRAWRVTRQSFFAAFGAGGRTSGVPASRDAEHAMMSGFTDMQRRSVATGNRPIDAKSYRRVMSVRNQSVARGAARDLSDVPTASLHGEIRSGTSRYLVTAASSREAAPAGAGSGVWAARGRGHRRSSSQRQRQRHFERAAKRKAIDVFKTMNILI